MIAAIIQARMGSTRFPGKMMETLDNKTIVQHVIERVKQAKLVDEIVLATSDDSKNKVLIQEVKKFGIKTFAGNENDVLDRYFQCAKEISADVVVRVTGDCPLIDPELIDTMISLFDKNDADYVSNVHPPTYPDGMDVEVFSYEALKKAWDEAKLKSEREHVTPYIWKNSKLFKCINLKNNRNLSDMRLTIDEKEDLIFLKELLKKINSNDYKLDDIIKAIEENPNLLKINNNFSRNEGYEKSLKQDQEEI